MPQWDVGERVYRLETWQHGSVKGKHCGRWPELANACHGSDARRGPVWCIVETAMDSKGGNRPQPNDTWPDAPAASDPLLGLRGSGRELWADEHTDEYIMRLRGGWE